MDSASQPVLPESLPPVVSTPGQRFAGGVLKFTGVIAALMACLAWAGAMIIAVLLPAWGGEEGGVLPAGLITLATMLGIAAAFVLLARLAFRFGEWFRMAEHRVAGSLFVNHVIKELSEDFVWILGLPLLAGGLFLTIAGHFSVGLAMIGAAIAIAMFLPPLAKSWGRISHE